ncbi:hypothetical protein DSM25558_0591 [Agrobacterium sp. DSM 25558]|uniref:hypothetical protein n=1 Tax=Agrobacterium sp. DSM 25558 TaxID=1907665 RepID=UPI0009725023|nr:hypothetical protein [Agrobacterium sp. DSM 25558]SCX03962.1 hypothetical protein DSM25558_0591 [Agrobacterium sp. DSM 25558]
MVSVVEDLKHKLADLDARLEEIRAEAFVLEAQKAAFATVIRVYDPEATFAPSPQSKSDKRSTPSRRVTDLLKGRDVRRGVLELLRDAENPILAGDLSRRFIEREGLSDKSDGVASNLAARFSGLLERLEQGGMVRSSGAPDGRRRLWEIAR